MPTLDELRTTPIASLLERYPFVESFLRENDLPLDASDGLTLDAWFTDQAEALEDRAVEPEALLGRMGDYIDQMLAFIGEAREQITSLSILPGTDKAGAPETYGELVLRAGQITSIVGPTGSGKSRLLADIEWVAQGDTPTKRRILLNGNPPDAGWRFKSSEKLVAQLSQNMNFVMDLTVREFLAMHAESRMVEEPEQVIERIIDQANVLAGEPFDVDTAITSLSGGQSRSLMIADTALLSRSPIVLIDEIENAGIDKRQALELLLSEEKIVLMATHDPLLALMGHHRIVIRNGGIEKIIETSDVERAVLRDLEAADLRMQALRGRLRNGEVIDALP